MNIALISYEFPPAVAVGGIGTYAWHASQMLADNGISVTVLAAGREGAFEYPRDGIEVRRVAAEGRPAFSRALVPGLLAAHSRSPFDLIEAPEIGPEGLHAFKALPSAARVLKLHTPGFLVSRHGFDPLPFVQRLHFFLGGLRRGRLALLRPPTYLRENDSEYHAALLADEIAAPTRAIGDVLQNEWSLDPGRISIYPLPFIPSAALLSLPVPTRLGTVGFLGRLEARKGVVEMMQAIPLILSKAPGLRFRLIGPSWPYAGTDMKTWILRRYPHLAGSIEFTGAVPPDEVPAELGRCDALVLPSRWESFGYTCCEAMASGRPVIGSAAGGMAEIIEPGVSGLLVPPRSPRAIAEAVLELYNHSEKIATLGAGGRQHVTALLAPQRILPLQLANYQRAIRNALIRNSRS